MATNSKLTVENDLKNILSIISDITGDISRDASMSTELLDVNIKTELAKKVEESIENPLLGAVDGLHAIEKSVHILIFQEVAIPFFTYNKNLFKSVYLRKKADNLLHFSVFFAKSDKNSKKEIFDFLNNYDKTLLKDRFPFIIEVIPEELEDYFMEMYNKNTDLFEKII